MKRYIQIKRSVMQCKLLSSVNKELIVQYPSRILLQHQEEYSREAILSNDFKSNVQQLVNLATRNNMVSISSPKGGWEGRAIVIFPDGLGNPDIWINPSIEGYSDNNYYRNKNNTEIKLEDRDSECIAPMYGTWENCASCFNVVAWVIRPQVISVTGLDLNGNYRRKTLDGISARLMLHEMDHLHGLTIHQQAQGPEFILSMEALLQRDQWITGFPSTEAHTTPQGYFFDYTSNNRIPIMNTISDLNAQRFKGKPQIES